MAVNLPKITDTTYLKLYCNPTKQNDNVTMTFPVNFFSVLEQQHFLWQL